MASKFIMAVFLAIVVYSNRIIAADDSARLFGDGQIVKNELKISADGNIDLLKEISSLKLERVGLIEDGEGFKVVEVRLEDVALFLNSHLPAKSGWVINMTKSAEGIVVNGHIDRDLMEVLIALMKEGDFYCHITKGLIEFHGSHVNKNLKVKGGLQTTVRKNLAKDWLKISGIFMIPTDPPSEMYVGNKDLVYLIQREIRFINKTESLTVENLTLNELVNLLNSKLVKNNKWKFTAAENAKLLRTSGKVDNNLILSLVKLMRHKNNFHCFITDGVIEFRKGAGNSLPVRKQ